MGHQIHIGLGHQIHIGLAALPRNLLSSLYRICLISKSWSLIATEFLKCFSCRKKCATISMFGPFRHLTEILKQDQPDFHSNFEKLWFATIEHFQSYRWQKSSNQTDFAQFSLLESPQHLLSMSMALSLPSCHFHFLFENIASSDLCLFTC